MLTAIESRIGSIEQLRYGSYRHPGLSEALVSKRWGNKLNLILARLDCDLCALAHPRLPQLVISAPDHLVIPKYVANQARSTANAIRAVTEVFLHDPSCKFPAKSRNGKFILKGAYIRLDAFFELLEELPLRRNAAFMPDPSSLAGFSLTMLKLANALAGVLDDQKYANSNMKRKAISVPSDVTAEQSQHVSTGDNVVPLAERGKNCEGASVTVKQEPNASNCVSNAGGQVSRVYEAPSKLTPPPSPLAKTPEGSSNPVGDGFSSSTWSFVPQFEHVENNETLEQHRPSGYLKESTQHQPTMSFERQCPHDAPQLKPSTAMMTDQNHGNPKARNHGDRRNAITSSSSPSNPRTSRLAKLDPVEAQTVPITPRSQTTEVVLPTDAKSRRWVAYMKAHEKPVSRDPQMRQRQPQSRDHAHFPSKDTSCSSHSDQTPSDIKHPPNRKVNNASPIPTVITVTSSEADEIERQSPNFPTPNSTSDQAEDESSSPSMIISDTEPETQPEHSDQISTPSTTSDPVTEPSNLNDLRPIMSQIFALDKAKRTGDLKAQAKAQAELQALAERPLRITEKERMEILYRRNERDFTDRYFERPNAVWWVL